MKASVTLPHDWFPKPLPANVLMGERSWCYSSFSCLHYQSDRPCGVRVGHDTGIYHGTFFDLGPEGEVEIGNYVTIVGAIVSTNTRIMIGDYAFLSHEVVLADSFAARPFSMETGRMDTSSLPKTAGIDVGQNCWIGARAVLLSGACVGPNAIIGAAAVVDFEVPPFAIVAGNPARIVGWTK